MNYKTLLALLLLSFLCPAQTYRFVYDYKFKTDTLAQLPPQSERMNLDIINSQTHFYAANLVQENNSGMAEAVPESPKVQWHLSGKGSEYQLTMPVFVNYYKITFVDAPQWKIMPEMQQWQGMKIQKATTHFLGRNWIAWFQADSQITAAPYRFSGLPGLVVKVEDEKASHQFELTETKKLAKLPNYDFLNDVESVAITPARFKEKWREYLENPIAVENQMMEAMGVVFNGSKGNAIKFNKEKNELKRQSLHKLNNLLEKELYY